MRLTRRARSLFLVAVPVLCVATADAAAPRFSNILPRGVQRGQEVEVTISGSNLEDAEELMLYDRGLTVLSLQHPDQADQRGKSLKVRLNVAADCPLGTQRLRIRTRTGMSELQNLHVGALPIVEEKEPNTDFAQPQPIEKNRAVHGRIEREDVDYFVVEAKQGERLSAEVFGMRFGNSSGGNYYDPYIAILNEDRFELAASDDSPLVWNDAVVSLIVPQDGKYIIQLRDAAYQGDGRAYYLLSVGNFPRPTGVIPAGGKPGEKLTITFVGDPLGPITREVTLPTDVPCPDRFGIDVQDELGLSPSAQPFRLSSLDNFIEQEPNNDREHATVAAAPAACNGVLGEPGDTDFFKFTAKKDQQFDVDVLARRVRSPLDPVVTVYKAKDGGSIGGNDDANRSIDATYRFKAPEDGDYVVAVRDHLKRGGVDFTYRIEIRPITPSVTAEPIEFARYVQTKIEIPQGSGRGLVANVQRSDFGGPVLFESADLPAGVRIECPEGWRGGGQIPVVLYAADDAPIGGKHSTIVTKSADPNQAVAGPLQQQVMMTRGQNNDRVWEELVTRLPVLVTERLPYRVWIEEPQVPIVKSGSLNLVVKCEKFDGYDEDISVLLLQNPSGVSSSTTAKIPKGQTETVINMNAAGNAAVGEWMIACRTISNVKNGSVEGGTPFVKLRVEEPYMNLKFAQGAVNQGAETSYVVTVEKRKDFEGEAQVTLVGLPANSTCEPLKLTKDMTELVFTIKAAENTPQGMNKNLICQVQVPEAGQAVAHNLGNGVLRVDPPKPKPKEPAVASAEAKPAAPAATPAKPLSRLEQLRLDQAEKEKAAAAAGGM
jgi:hypothetical protein